MNRRQIWGWVSAAFVVLSTPLGVAQAQPAACTPQCRAGYLCVRNQCVSACNPPCAAGEQCTPQGECLPPPPSTPQSVAPAPLAPAPGPSTAAPPGAPGAAPAQPGYAPPAPTPAPAPVAPAPAAPEPAKPSSLPHNHDGFYLRLGLGAGYLTGDISTPDLEDDGVTDQTPSGLAFLGEFAIGTTVAPGIVIGGGSYSVSVPSPMIKVTAGGQSVDFKAGAATLSSIGPFIDYYFDPSKGLHAQAALLLTYVSVGKGTANQQVGETLPGEKSGGTGYGAMLGLGYEAWIGDEWSVGGLARLTYASASIRASGDDDDDASDTSLWIPGAVFTVTYH